MQTSPRCGTSECGFFGRKKSQGERNFLLWSENTGGLPAKMSHNIRGHFLWPIYVENMWRLVFATKLWRKYVDICCHCQHVEREWTICCQNGGNMYFLVPK